VLGPVVEAHPVAVDAHVLAPQRRQPVRVVVAGVLLVADAEQPEVEQAQREGEDLLAVQRRRAVQERVEPGAQGGQGGAEVEHVVELAVLALGPELRVVPVLLAPGGVVARRLQVGVGGGRDPHVTPRGRDRESRDAPERRRVGHRRAAGAGQRPVPGTGEPGAGSVDVHQSGHAASLRGVRARGVRPCRRQ
jgi:hypothetical protein